MHFRCSNGNPKFWPAFALPGLLQSSLLLLSNYPQHLGTEWSPALVWKVTLTPGVLHFEHDKWQQTSWSNCHWVVGVYVKIWRANKSMHKPIHFIVNMHTGIFQLSVAMMCLFPATLPHILHSLTLPSVVASTCLEMISAFFSASIFQRCSSDACAARDTSRASSDCSGFHGGGFNLAFATGNYLSLL